MKERVQKKQEGEKKKREKVIEDNFNLIRQISILGLHISLDTFLR